MVRNRILNGHFLSDYSCEVGGVRVYTQLILQSGRPQGQPSNEIVEIRQINTMALAWVMILKVAT